MSDILSRLFYGEIDPFETTAERSPEAAELYEKYKSQRDALEEKLPADLKEDFDKLITTRIDLGVHHAEEAFKEGFRVACQLFFSGMQE
ncbi:MAG: hypothetical protein IJ766_05060 [Clostridia bacterium]|nr:hypothetical protein [Clostridia bacterium]